MQRTVRHLRLAAPSRALALRLLPRLEDALRCASLPDDGARLLVLRRLALGALPADISAGALARLIEQRVATGPAGGWVAADHPAAETAAGVVFSSPLDARCRLALRLLQGAPCQAWYWPLAVPEYQPGLGRGDNLRRLAQAVATLPEAHSALPAFVAPLLRAGLGPQLAALVPPAEGEALLQQAGWPLPPRPSPPVGRAGPAWGRTRGAQSVDGGGGVAIGPGPQGPSRDAAEREPAWLRVLAQAAGVAPADRRDGVPEAVRPAPQAVADRAAERAVRGWPGRPAVPMADPKAGPAPGPMPDPAAGDAALHDAVLPAVANAGPAGTSPGPLPRAATATAPGLPMVASPWTAGAPGVHLAAGQATAAGGLLFLLPLLDRLGLPQALATHGDPPAFTAAVLRAALRRLGLPADDAAWRLTTAPAPAETPDAVAQATWWLTACRHWLRRSGRIGLASLVCRPARLALTATHADLHFRLADTDLRVRRLGLDIDPGWLPWFGRVVAFHYTAADPP